MHAIEVRPSMALYMNMEVGSIFKVEAAGINANCILDRWRIGDDWLPVVTLREIPAGAYTDERSPRFPNKAGALERKAFVPPRNSISGSRFAIGLGGEYHNVSPWLNGPDGRAMLVMDQPLDSDDENEIWDGSEEGYPFGGPPDGVLAFFRTPWLFPESVVGGQVFPLFDEIVVDVSWWSPPDATPLDMEFPTERRIAVAFIDESAKTRSIWVDPGVIKNLGFKARRVRLLISMGGSRGLALTGVDLKFGLVDSGVVVGIGGDESIPDDSDPINI